MTDDLTDFSVLLIDDEPAESETVRRILAALTDRSFVVDHVEKCSAAVSLLQTRRFDLVLLDNHLSRRISAKFSVPIIKSAIGRSPLAIISNDVSPDYLADPATLGVDYVVDKSEMIEFLESMLHTLFDPDGGLKRA